MKDFQSLQDMLGHYPVVGALVSIFQLFAGILIGASGISPVVKDLFQIGAWAGAIGVSALTVIGLLKKHTTLLDKWKFLKK